MAYTRLIPTRTTSVILNGGFGSLAPGVLGRGMIAMITASGSEMKTRIAAYTRVEILVHCLVLSRPMPDAKPQPPKAKVTTASMTRIYPRFTGASAGHL